MFLPGKNLEFSYQRLTSILSLNDFAYPFLKNTEIKIFPNRQVKHYICEA